MHKISAQFLCISHGCRASRMNLVHFLNIRTGPDIYELVKLTTQ